MEFWVPHRWQPIDSLVLDTRPICTGEGESSTNGQHWSTLQFTKHVSQTEAVSQWIDPKRCHQGWTIIHSSMIPAFSATMAGISQAMHDINGNFGSAVALATFDSSHVFGDIWEETITFSKLVAGSSMCLFAIWDHIQTHSKYLN